MGRYIVQKCDNCRRYSRATQTTVQAFIFSLLIALGIIPGIIYWYFSKGKCCQICGIKYKDKK